MCGIPGVTVACDGKCEKAWGNNNRPKIYFDRQGNSINDQWEHMVTSFCDIESALGIEYDEELYDEDDYCFLTDDELPDAPINPGTSEGGHFKPQHPDDRLNKWCARECERSEIIDPGKPIIIRTFDEPFYNQPWLHEGEQ
jgi:hypothetical protein